MKNKWYRSNLTKGILIAAEHVFVALIVAAVLCVASYPSYVEEMLKGRTSKDYEHSLALENSMMSCSEEALYGISAREMLETDGKLDLDKLVDIAEFYYDSTLSGENNSGLAYRLGDLLNWDVEWFYGYDDYMAGYDVNDFVSEATVVCEREDGTYQYYQYRDFEDLVQQEKLKVGGFYRSDSTLLEYISELGMQNGVYLPIRDEDGKELFVNCWTYQAGTLKEEMKPVGAESILDIVNNNEQWNGHLSEAYNMLFHTTEALQEEYRIYLEAESTFAEGETNFQFIYADKDTGKVYTNCKKYEGYENLNKSLEEIKDVGAFAIVGSTLGEFESNLDRADAASWEHRVDCVRPEGGNILFAAAVDTAYPIQDQFYTDSQMYSSCGALVRPLVVFGAIALVLFMAGLVWLTIIAGRNDVDDDLHLARLDHWKTEISAIVVTGVVLALLMGAFVIAKEGALANRYMYSQRDAYTEVVVFSAAAAAVCVAAFACFLTGYLSLVRRIKARTLWKDSLLRQFVVFVKCLFNHLRETWKTLVLFGSFVIINWILWTLFYNSSWAIFLIILFFVEVAAAAWMFLYAVGKEKIKTGIQKIAEGDLEYKISTEKMIPSHKEIAEKINAIGGGLDAAVEKSMRSERMKTDLITNVSHDIKTPLTSIINYVDLLKKENFEDPKIQRYLEILEQKSQRLKILTEDVVEASKVSSGNISLECMKINFVEMIQQTSGEFEEKFKKRNLKEILTLPEQDVVIYVDGRRTWRVLENIYNNAAKYAMEGSRIYADLKIENDQAVFALKNISEQPLNISADELTERFIRGDISRSTEGSGLGLSIAKSLTKLQGGTFDIYLDGDLFKVTMKFPLIEDVAK